MRVTDPNLLSSTAASSSSYSSASSRRSQKDDSSFGDVYNKTASERDRRNDYASTSASKRAANDDDAKQVNRESKAQNNDSENVQEKPVANAQDEGAEAAKQKSALAQSEKRVELEKALANAKHMNASELEKLAADMGLSREDLAKALEELAKGMEKAATEGATTQATGTGQLEESDIAALFRLLVGQKKAADEAQTAKDTKAEGSDEKAAASAASGEEAQSASADDIADLLNALSAGNRTQNEKLANADDAAKQGATTFRFERADGKGVPVELQIGGMKDGDTLEKGQGASKTENVTVLDARRYLAPTDINASNIVSNIAGDKTWASALKSAPTANIPMMTPEKVITEVNTLKLQMHPVDLGTVTATLRLKGDELVVSMSVHNSEAYNQLNADKEKIMQSLRAQGFSVDQISVQLSAVPDRGVQQSAAGQQQQDGQQMAGNNGEAARQYQQDGNRRQQANGQDSFQTVEDMGNVGVGASADGDSRDGQIYL